MRGVFGLVGLVVALAIVAIALMAGLQATKQLASTRTPVPSLQQPAASSGAGTPAPTGTVREQSQQVQQQVKQQMEGLMQQARPMPDDSK